MVRPWLGISGVDIDENEIRMRGSSIKSGVLVVRGTHEVMDTPRDICTGRKGSFWVQ